MRKLLAIATLSLLVGIAACASEGDDPAGPDGDGATATTAAGGDDEGAEGAGGDGGGDGGSGGTAGDGTAGNGGEDSGDGEGAGGEDGAGGEGGGDVMGSATADLPASATNTTSVPLRLDVVSLRRLDGMVELRAVVTHEGGGDAPDWRPGTSFDDPRLPAGEGENSLSGAALVDAEAQRAWLPMIDSEGTCLCSTGLDTTILAPGDTVELHADFGGVPDDLTHVEVQVPGFETIARVPVG